MSRRGAAVFVALGAIAALAVQFHESDAWLQFRLVVAIALLLAIGTWVEERLGLDGRSFPFHRVVLGQAALCAWFYARSLLPIFRITGFELYLIAFLAVADLVRRRRAVEEIGWRPLGALAIGWGAWWLSTMVFVALRSGQLATLSSDPDIHAFYAKLTAEVGRVPLDQQPYASDAVTYPGGLAVENAVWMLLSGTFAAKTVNTQIALQSCLAVGLVVEMLLAVRKKPSWATTLVVIAVAHYIFSFPVNPECPNFEKTARLAHKAMALLPLGIALRYEGERLGRLVIAGAFGVFSIAWAFVMNPANAIAELPILVAAGIVAAARPRGETKPWRAFAVVTMAAAVAIVFADPFVRTHMPSFAQLSPVRSAHAQSSAPRPSENRVTAGVTQALDESTAGIFAPACLRGAHCPAILDGARTSIPLVSSLLAMAALLAFRRKLSAVERAACVAVLAIAAGQWCAAFLAGAAAADGGAASLYAVLLRLYTEPALRIMRAMLFLALIAVLLAGLAAALERRLKHADVMVAALVAVVAYFGWGSDGFARIATDYRRHVIQAPQSNLGPIAPSDVLFARRVSEIVPKDERVLLLGYTVKNELGEHWNFAWGPSRAIPLYSTAKFAFFHGVGGGVVFTADEFEKRVCSTFDLPWLAERGVRWLFMPAGPRVWTHCPRAFFQVAPDYFEEALRLDGRVLYKLRADRLEAAKSDARLGR